MVASLAVLVIADSDEDALLTVEVLQRAGYAVRYERVCSIACANEALGRQKWDLILVDCTAQGANLPALAASLGERGLETPLIALADTDDDGLVARALNEGADDCITRGELARLAPVVAREVRAAARRRARSRTNELLWQAEERYRQLAESLNAAVVCLDSQGVITYASPRCRDILGWEPGEVIGRWYGDVGPAEDGARIAAAMRHTDGKFMAGDYEVTIAHADGHLVPLSLHVSPLHGADGAAIGAQVIFRDLTDRRRAEHDLQEAQYRLATTLEFLPDATFVIDTEGRVIAWNRAIEEMTGVGKEEILGQGEYAYAVPFYGHRRPVLIDLIGAEGADAVAAYDHVTRAGDTIYAEVFVPSVYGGRGAYLWMAASALLDATGRRVGAIESVRDVTARRLAERALRDSEERFRDLAERSFDIIFATDADGHMTYVSPSVERIVGRTPDEILGTRWTEYVVPSAAGSATVEIADRLSRGEIFEGLELPIRRKDGGIAHLDFNVSPIIRSGTVVGAHGIGRDVTERRAAVEALRESEQRFRDLFHGLPACCYTFSADGTILDWNGACVTVYGWQAEDATGRAVADLLAREEHAEALRRVVKAVFRGRAFEGVEFEALRSNGETCSILANLYPLKDARGEVVMGMFAGFDVTSHRRLTEQLRQAQKMEAVGQLAGGIAHDFNNLLTVINGYSSIVVRSLDSDHPLRQDALEVLAAGERAATLTRQLLAFSRRQVLETRVLDLNEVIEGMGKMLYRLIGEHIHLETRLAPDLGMVRADPGQIEQVIINLAVNARDAMPQGGTLTIETANLRHGESCPMPLEAPGATPIAEATQPDARSEGGTVLLSVRDTGTGMTTDVQEHLFEPFFTTKEPGAGTGLGLSTVYGIVKQSGGDITVETLPDRGTTFRIYFPTVRADHEPVAADEEIGVMHGTETVLLVEDQANVRRLTGRMLRQLGYAVIEATRGDEALARLMEGGVTIDLVIADVVMPDMDGQRLVEALRTRQSDFAVLYMSGYSDGELLRRGMHDAEAPFVAKPFTLEELGRKVREVLDGRRPCDRVADTPTRDG